MIGSWCAAQAARQHGCGRCGADRRCTFVLLVTCPGGRQHQLHSTDMPPSFHRRSQHHLQPMSRSLGASSWKKYSFQLHITVLSLEEGVVRLVRDGPVPRKPCRQLHVVLKWLHPAVCSSLHVVNPVLLPSILLHSSQLLCAGPILLLQIDSGPITVSLSLLLYSQSVLIVP